MPASRWRSLMAGADCAIVARDSMLTAQNCPMRLTFERSQKALGLARIVPERLFARYTKVFNFIGSPSTFSLSRVCAFSPRFSVSLVYTIYVRSVKARGLAYGKENVHKAVQRCVRGIVHKRLASPRLCQIGSHSEAKRWQFGKDEAK